VTDRNSAYTERSLGLQSREHELPMLLVWCTRQQHQVRDEVLVAIIARASSLRAELISELQHDMTLALAGLRLAALLSLLTLLPEETQTRLQGTPAGDPLMAFGSLLQGEAIDGEIATVRCAVYSFWEALSIKGPESNTISEFLGLVLGSHNAEGCHDNLLVTYWRARGEGSHSYAMEELFLFLAASSLELKSRNSQKPGHINFGLPTGHRGSHGSSTTTTGKDSTGLVKTRLVIDGHTGVLQCLIVPRIATKGDILGIMSDDTQHSYH